VAQAQTAENATFRWVSKSDDPRDVISLYDLPERLHDCHNPGWPKTLRGNPLTSALLLYLVLRVWRFLFTTSRTKLTLAGLPAYTLNAFTTFVFFALSHRAVEKARQTTGAWLWHDRAEPHTYRYWTAHLEANPALDLRKHTDKRLPEFRQVKCLGEARQGSITVTKTAYTKWTWGALVDECAAWSIAARRLIDVRRCASAYVAPGQLPGPTEAISIEKYGRINFLNTHEDDLKGGLASSLYFIARASHDAFVGRIREVHRSKNEPRVLVYGAHLGDGPIKESNRPSVDLNITLRPGATVNKLRNAVAFYPDLSLRDPDGLPPLIPLIFDQAHAANQISSAVHRWGREMPPTRPDMDELVI